VAADTLRLVTVPTMPQPGWYTDPYHGPGLRWWDGRGWSPHVRPPRPRPPAHTGRNERMGRYTVVSQAVLSIVVTVAVGYVMARVIGDFGPYLDTAAATPPDQVPPLPDSFVLLGALSLLGMVGWIPLVLELMWAYRCATAAAALGIPARRDPVWAMVSWFIPVISWWFPYESIRDCLPPGHPERRTVGRWWAGYVVGTTGVFAGVAAALVSTVALAAVAVVYAAVAVVTALLGLRVARAIDAAHRERMAELTGQPRPPSQIRPGQEPQHKPQQGPRHEAQQGPQHEARHEPQQGPRHEPEPEPQPQRQPQP